ncbi:sialin-like isoform X2 [Tubulanus polymorphus]
MQGYVLSSFFYGYILTQFAGGYLARRFGAKYLFGGGIAITGLLTLFTPVLAKVNVWVLVASRVLMGICEGVTFPAIHTLWSKWAPPLERSKLAITTFSGAYSGTVVAMIISGLMAEHLNWEAIFYFFGGLAIAWFMVWCLLITESPQTHPSITRLELEYIEHSIGFSDKKADSQATPWKSIFTSLPVMAITVAHFGENWGFYTLLTGLPSFMNNVFHFSLQKSGFLAALPYLVMALAAQLGGNFADCLRGRLGCSTTLVRKLFNAVAFSGQAIFLIIVGFTPNINAAVVSLTLAVGLGGFCYAGFAVNHLDIAPQYAGILMGITNTVATIPGIVSPIITGQIVQHKLASEWRIVFFIAAAIYLASMVVYVIFASGETQQWAKIANGYEVHSTLTDVEEEDEEDEKNETVH